MPRKPKDVTCEGESGAIRAAAVPTEPSWRGTPLGQSLASSAVAVADKSGLSDGRLPRKRGRLAFRSCMQSRRSQGDMCCDARSRSRRRRHRDDSGLAGDPRAYAAACSLQRQVVQLVDQMTVKAVKVVALFLAQRRAPPSHLDGANERRKLRDQCDSAPSIGRHLTWLSRVPVPEHLRAH